MRKVQTLAAIAALTLAGGAYAQSQGVPGVDVNVNASAGMVKSDKNSDGKISKSEAASDAKLAKQFDKLDANKDGNLDQAEFAKFEASGSASGGASKDGAPGKDEGEPANPNKPGTTDDSTPSNPDKLGPGR
jgi:hypothetical protein